MTLYPPLENGLNPSVGRPTATLGLAVGDHLKRLIVLGALEPGEPLKEQELAAQLQISSTPIREALNRLSDLGLVEIVSNKAKRVAALDDEQAMDVLDTHALLSDTAYRLAVGKIDTIGCRQFRFQAQSLKIAADRNDAPTALAIVDRLHGRLLEAGGSKEMQRVIATRREYLLRHILLRCDNWICEEMPRYHSLMIAAVENRNVEELLSVRDETICALKTRMAGIRTK